MQMTAPVNLQIRPSWCATRRSGLGLQAANTVATTGLRVPFCQQPSTMWHLAFERLLWVLERSHHNHTACTNPRGNMSSAGKVAKAHQAAVKRKTAAAPNPKSATGHRHGKYVRSETETAAWAKSTRKPPDSM